MAYDLETLAKAKISLLRKQAWNDLYIFSKYVCGKNLMEEQPHKELCDFLMHGLDTSSQLDLKFTPSITTPEINIENYPMQLNKLLMLPRGSFKSSIGSNTLVLWLLWHNPNLRVMIDSETLSNSKLYLAGIKDMMENHKLLKIICTDEKGVYALEPNRKTSGGFTEDQMILLNRTSLGQKEPSIFCAGVDNARTGLHPDIIIMDDLVSERNVGTNVQLSKVKDHYKFSISLLEPGGLHLIIGTRYHMADLYGDLIDNKSFDTLIRPAVDENGKLYFPQRLDKERLDTLRIAQGSAIFNCQYMLNPIDDSLATFRRETIQYYKELPEFVVKYITVDLAISQKETADYTVVMCCGLTKDKKLYVLEYDRGHYLPEQTKNAIFAMYERHDDLCKAVGIETVFFQKTMIYTLKEEMRKRCMYMPLKELKADKDKLRRIRALQPLFENRDVYIRRDMHELEIELAEFPKSSRDDLLDAMAYVLQLMRVGNIGEVRKRYTYTPSNAYVSY